MLAKQACRVGKAPPFFTIQLLWDLKHCIEQSHTYQSLIRLPNKKNINGDMTKMIIVQGRTTPCDNKVCNAFLPGSLHRGWGCLLKVERGL
jgi:hypothetical protein